MACHLSSSECCGVAAGFPVWPQAEWTRSRQAPVRPRSPGVRLFRDKFRRRCVERPFVQIALQDSTRVRRLGELSLQESVPHPSRSRISLVPRWNRQCSLLGGCPSSLYACVIRHHSCASDVIFGGPYFPRSLPGAFHAKRAGSVELSYYSAQSGWSVS